MQSGLHFKPGESNISAWTPSLISMNMYLNEIFLFQATANTRLAGAMGAYFLKFLHKTFHLDLYKVHMIGHSLGAHLSG